MSSDYTVETDEIWKIHPSCDGRYMVSNTGKVMNHRRGHLMSLQVSLSTPYPHFATKVGGRNGQNVLLRVHRMVAELFVPNPDNLPYVNHKDGDKTNNHYTNLEWCTQSENILHAFRTGLAKPKKGSDANGAKLTDEDAAHIREVYTPYSKLHGSRALAKCFDVDHKQILRVVNNKSYN